MKISNFLMPEAKNMNLTYIINSKYCFIFVWIVRHFIYKKIACWMNTYLNMQHMKVDWLGMPLLWRTRSSV